MCTKKFYLKLLMSLLLMALTVPQLKAETLTVTVADGTDTNVSLPIWGANANSNDCESQVIYPSDELNIPAGSIIKKIEFFATGYTSSNLKPTVQVALLNTTESTVSSSTMTSNRTNEDAVIIYNGTFPYGEMTASFDCNFQYTGDNLMVDFYVSSGSTRAANTTWYGKNVSNNVGGHWKWTNASFYSETFLPKMKVTYEPGTIAEYSAKVSPESLSFGSVQVGSSSNLNVLLKNKGTKGFTYTISGLSAPFSTTVTGGTLAAGAADLNIPVTFAPTAAGTFEDDLVISFDSETGLNPITVHVTGTGSDAICDGTDYNESLPVRGWDFDANQQINQMVYPKLMVEGKLKNKKITGITFYPATVNTTSGINFYKNSSNPGTVTLKLKNLESATPAYATTPVRIEGATTVSTITMPTSAQTSLTEWTFELDEPFEYTDGDLLIEVETTKGGYGRTYFYGVNQETNTSYYSLGGTGTVQQFLPKVTFAVEDSETPATPVITVNPATVEAFTTEVGTHVTATVNVTGENLTDAITATVSGTNAAYFTAVLENGVLTITYNPTEAGENHTATVTLSSTGAQDVTIALTGTATAPAVDYAVTMSDNSGAHNYGNVLVNSSNVWTLTITNNGTELVTPTLSGIEAPFSTNYTAAALAAGESVTITFTFAPTEVNEYSNTITISFPEAGDAIAAYTCQLTGKAIEQSPEPSGDDNEVVKLITVDKRSIYEPNFIDEANGNTTPQQLNCYDMRFKMAQPDDLAKKIKAGDLRPGNNLYEFYAIDDFGTEFRFATINLFAEGEPSSNPSVSAMDAPIKVTPSVEYYTEDGMPVHPNHKHNTTLNYTEKIYNDINELVDLEGVIDYVNDTWSANTATNAHPDHYKFQIRGVGQFGEKVTELTAEYVKTHIGDYGLIDPEGWYRSMVVAPNNEYDDDGNYVDTYYFYDLYISNEFLQSKGITGPVTVVINTTLSKSGYNADEFKTISVNGVDQIIAKEKFKDYSWTVPLVDEMHEGKSMGIVIRSETRPGSDFNKTRSIYIYGGGTGVSNVKVEDIYKSSMNVKAYTQKQADEDTDRNLVAMNAGAKTDVNVLAYGDPAVTGYVLNKNTSASTTGMTQVATANHETNGDYSVSSTGTYNGRYPFVRDESLGNIDGMWLPMYPAAENEYYLPVTWANGVGDDGVVRSENNTYGSAMQQVEKNGSVDFASSSKCIKSDYTWVKDGVEYAIYNPVVDLTSTLPAETGYQLYNYRLWVDYDDNEPAWDYDENLQFIGKMDRPLYSGTETHIGATGQSGQKDECAFAAPNNLEQVKLVARFYYKKTSTSTLKARPTDKDRLYYVVENQLTIPMSQIVTGVEDVTNKAVAGVMYYNLAGMQSEEPFSGVNIVVTRYTDGSISTAKVLK